jgi:hypothetical protein
MQKLGWYLVALCMLAGACEKNERDEAAVSVPLAGQAGTVASGGSTGGLALGVGGSITGIGAEPNGGRPPVDLSGVPMPVVRCAATAAGGAPEDSAGGAAGSPETKPGAGGAAWDETCAPPPSTCIGDITLVYFDEGECVAGVCEWHKRSLDCLSSCQSGGCQDSITTK